MHQKRIFKYIMTLLAGVAIGFGLSSVFRSNDRQAALDPMAATESEAVTDWQSQKATLLEKLRAQDAEMARLQVDLINARQESGAMASNEAEEALDQPDEQTEPAPPRRPGFLRRMEAQFSQRAAEMVAGYGLSEEQGAELQDVYRQYIDTIQARRMGEDVESMNLDDAIANILTEEQFNDYLEQSQQEILNRAELIATTELVRLNQAVDLSPEVQDSVYDVIHYTAQEMMIARQTGADFDMSQAIKERLGGLLTPEQLEVYQTSVMRGRGPRP